MSAEAIGLKIEEVMGKEATRTESVGGGALTKLYTAKSWLMGISSADVFAMYDKYVEKVIPKRSGASKMWHSLTSLVVAETTVNPELLSQLIEGAAWSSKLSGQAPEKTMASVEAKFEAAKASKFYAEYAADVAVIAESHNAEIAPLMKLIDELKEDPKLLTVNMEYNSTAVTIASAIYAEGEGSRDKVVDLYVDLAKATGGKLGEAGLSALLQASLLGDKVTALKRLDKLSKQVIKPTDESGSEDEVTYGTKAYLVLSETIGKWDPKLTVGVMQEIMSKYDLSQSVAARFILGQANKQSDNPVISRQGQTNAGEMKRVATVEYAPNPVVASGKVPIGGGQVLTTKEDYRNYTAAIRLGSKK
jgi:hypothetical protein